MLFCLFTASSARAQSRVNLDDVKIDGELQKEGLSLSARQHFTIEDEIEVRQSFKDLMIAYLPEGYHKVSGGGAATQSDTQPTK